MKNSVEERCIVCHLVFCCGDCRWRHEKITHGLTYDCPICRGRRFLCRPEDLNEDFIHHLTTEHLPLQCKKCNKFFLTMEDFDEIDKCTTISELVDEDKKDLNVDDKFDSIYEKVNNNDADKFEAIVSVNNTTKTAIITPIVRKKYLVDYESSDTDYEDSPKEPIMATPHPKLAPKTPKFKRQRIATPHAKKFLSLMRQQVVEEEENIDIEDDDYDDSPISKTTPSRSENNEITDSGKDMTTPNSHLPHVMKLAQIVTTSTPTHPAAGGNWSMFPGPGNDSPLSEIETTESPAQSIDKEMEPCKTDDLAPKLKSIIIIGSRPKLGSQDSSEKQVTFQDSENNNESSIKTKKVKFADDTVFEQEPKRKRVFRKPKRMLTPGPQKPRYTYNPRFQALINRFESQAMTLARTPLNTKEHKEKDLEDTPPAGDHNKPARAISFKDDSPVVETESQSKESNELFNTCVESPVGPINNAISTLTANIAGSLQTCLTSVLRSTDDETEIQFKFVITKKKVCVRRIAEDGICENLTEVDREEQTNKENIWSSVARAVKNVFWGNQVTPYTQNDSSDSSSASKRKFEQMSDSEMSPLNHKRHKYEGRIRGRPPLHRSRPCGVSTLRNSHSAEQHSIFKELSMNQDDAMNLSF
ncbi:uncharacterized protein LOC125068794 isoform X1 [Vanessa atalanta]|uniref:uncharacterized protein LOC125068794 isoform X1 n=1 Tax=Vanessa atalanta TaxID=42275 RepID=UPI001FCCF153|nr:uncharacterized protein LOC125068794 isoform X1 [Vanessa atalanta]